MTTSVQGQLGEHGIELAHLAGQTPQLRPLGRTTAGRPDENPWAMGRITQMVSQDGTSAYGYDSKSQLTSATHSYQSNESYTFDNNGNRTMSGYQTGTDNRLTNDGTYSYTYDAEGNRLTRTKTATGEVTEYTWDYHNRLTKVTEKNSQGTVTQVVEYLYDVFNRRIGRKIDTSAPFDMANAVIERYVLDDIHNGLTSADGGNVVLDFVDPDGSGAQAIAMSKRYLYGEAVDQLFAQEDLSKTLGDTTRNLWPLVDHLGTVRDLAKQDGTIATHFKYDSFGNVTSGDTSKTRYLFTSREFDTATKLQYNRARYYDAAVGRWISEDPLGFAAGDNNNCRYNGNSATGTVDPSGMQGNDPLKQIKDIQKFFQLYDDGWGLGDLPSVGIGIGGAVDPPPDRTQIEIPGTGIEVGINDAVTIEDLELSFIEHLRSSIEDRLRPYYPGEKGEFPEVIGDLPPEGRLNDIIGIAAGAISDAAGGTIKDVYDPKITFRPGGLGDWITIGGAGSIAAGLINYIDTHTPLGGMDFSLPITKGDLGALHYGVELGRADGNGRVGLDITLNPGFYVEGRVGEILKAMNIDFGADIEKGGKISPRTGIRAEISW